MAQAVCITTAIRALMHRGLSPTSTSPVRAAHPELVAALAGNPPNAIPIAVDSSDLDGRADHLEKLLAALQVYLTAIMGDTAQHAPGSAIDQRYLQNLFDDFASDTVGMIQ